MNFKKEKSLREKAVDLITEHYGLEIGEEFEFVGGGYNPYKFTSDGLIDKDGDRLYDWIDRLIRGKDKIKKLPQKPKLTEAERVILENLPKEYKWIERDNALLVLYSDKWYIIL